MSHPTRESFRQFSNLDPQARLDEFQKRFDRMKSEFHNTPTRQMFESANRPYYAHTPQWTGAHNQDAQPANGHVPVEKTIPIQVQHERSRSEPVAAETGVNSANNSSATGYNNIPHDPRMHFMPDDSYFQHKFQSPFPGGMEGSHPSMPNTGEGGEGSSGGGEPRVHRIPIQVETRSANNPVPMGYSKSASSPSPTPSGGGGGGGGISHYVSSQGGPISQPNLHPQQQHPQPNPFISATSTSSSPFDSRPASGRNIEIPIQIAKSSSSPAPSKKVDNSFQGAANSAAAVNESASDPAIADPNQVYAMGYEPLAANNSANSQTAEKLNEGGKKETPFDYVKEVLDDLKNYESQVHEFSCTSTSDKGYRWLDEMLTLCILRLDCINIDGNDELRKYRKSAINEVNRVAAILESKVSKADSTAASEKTPSQQNESQGQQQQCSSGDATTQPNGLVAQPKPEDKQTSAAVAANTTAEQAVTEPKNKKEAKKLEKAKAKKEKEEKEKAKKEAAAGEKKEGRRIILFRGKNKNKTAAAQNNEETGGTSATSNSAEAMDLDTNNNDLKDGKDGSTTGGSQSANSDQASETASSTTSSSTTLQGKETAV